MKHRIIYTKRSESDLRALHSWASQGGETVADRWVSRFLSEITALKDYPERGRPAPDDPYFSIPIRQILIGKGRGQHRVLYTIRGDEIWILHLRHSMRRYLHESPDEPGLDAPGDET
ncbi:MAG: type II toxin-antitoxin system RelE/ParE family toxin [Verrucomicrobiae bacterium]|nr:type II toxin-antitoxin system RelE/ParE family toxin [Verrucomicrobiae bacterium]